MSPVTSDQKDNLISGTVKSTIVIWIQCFPPAPLCLQWVKGVMIFFFFISLLGFLGQSSCDICQVREEWETKKKFIRLLFWKLTLISSGCGRYWEIPFLLQNVLWAHWRHSQISHHHLSSTFYSRWRTTVQLATCYTPYGSLIMGVHLVWEI